MSSSFYVMAPSGAPGKKLTIVLQALYHLNKEQRQALLRKADPQLIRCICECALNILRGNIPLPKSQRVKLRTHKNLLRTLASEKRGLKSKKQIIVQKGGFLPLLLAPILGTIISNAIAR